MQSSPYKQGPHKVWLGRQRLSVVWSMQGSPASCGKLHQCLSYPLRTSQPLDWRKVRSGDTPKKSAGSSQEPRCRQKRWDFQESWGSLSDARQEVPLKTEHPLEVVALQVAQFFLLASQKRLKMDGSEAHFSVSRLSCSSVS